MTAFVVAARHIRGLRSSLGSDFYHKLRLLGSFAVGVVRDDGDAVSYTDAVLFRGEGRRDVNRGPADDHCLGGVFLERDLVVDVEVELLDLGEAVLRGMYSEALNSF